MGFFHPDVKKAKKHKADMPTELMHQLGCKACPRNKDAALVTPKIEPSGAAGKQCTVYILGEAPGESEDELNKHFCGKAGQLLRSAIPKNAAKQVRWNNTIRCRPPNSRAPLPQEVECCRNLQRADIAEHKPEVVVLVGMVPTNWLMPGSGQGISKWRGRFVPIQVDGHTCWAYPILHPSGVKGNRRGGFKSELHKVFERDLKTLFKKLRHGLPDPIYTAEKDRRTGMDWITRGDSKNLERVKRTLDKMSQCRVNSIDIETKNLRPYKEDSALLTVSISTRKHGTFVFPLAWPGYWKTPELEAQAFKALEKFIRNSGRKVCHNTKFEQEWFAYYFGMDCILKTKWADTMAQAYVLDSRKGMLNLDILIRMHFGFDLKAESPEIDRKQIWKSNLDDLLPYNGLDTKWTLELYFKLRSIVSEEGLTAVVAERVRTGATLVGAMLEGVPANMRTARKLKRKLRRRIEGKREEARQTRAWKKFVKQYGRDPNIDSHPDMVKFFGEIMSPPECRTASGGITTTDDVLTSLSPKRYPVAPIITEMRSLQTIKGTFVDPLPRLVYPDGKLHTSYGHLFTTSGRTNSEDPNLQNWPKQSEWKVIRGIIEDLLEDLWVISFDYGQIEARVIAMASQDPTFVQMLWDSYDVHMEWATRIHDEWRGCLKAMGIEGKFSDPAVAKKYRQEVKNKWVFPLFFGAQEYSVANNLNMPTSVVGNLYDEFWGIFAGIKEWQEELISRYERVGYVETLTGRRRHAPCNYNEQINHPIQGTASDIVCAAGARLQDKGIQFNLNVHDDLSFIMANDEKQIKQIAKEMCRPVHDFVNVPLLVEVEGGPTWSDQKSIVEYASDKDFNFH